MISRESAGLSPTSSRSSSATATHVGRGEAAPIERYDETAESALAFVREHADAARRRPVRARGDRQPAGGDPGRAGRQGGARRGPARPAGQAARRARVAAARPAADRPADVVDDLARRPRRHGAPHRGVERPVPAAEAQARRRRRPRRRARSCRPRRARGRRSRSTSTSGGRSTRRSTRSRSSRSSASSTRAAVAAPATPAAGCSGSARRSRSTSTRTVIRSPTSPHCARDRARDQHQAREVGRDPRGGADGACRPRARSRRHARLHGRVGARDRGRCIVAPLCDHVDLDGNLLLAEDPCPGVTFTDGVQVPSEEAGSRCRLAAGLLDPRRGLLRRSALRQDDARRPPLPRRGRRRDPRLDAGGGDASRAYPIVADVEAALALGPTTALVGVATQGGRFPPAWRELLRDCVAHGISVENGLHEFIRDDPELAPLAAASRRRR